MFLATCQVMTVLGYCYTPINLGLNDVVIRMVQAVIALALVLLLEVLQALSASVGTWSMA